MKNLLFIVFLLPFLGFSQTYVATQIGEDIEGNRNFDHLGGPTVISKDGLTVAFGSRSLTSTTSNGRVVYVYRNILGIWTQIGDSLGLTGRSHSISLSYDGNIIAIGDTDGNDSEGNSVGDVEIYEYISGTWMQIGEDIDGVDVSNGYSAFGNSVSLSRDGNILAIADYIHPGNAISTGGAVRIYENIFRSWTQIGEDIYGDESQDYLGRTITLSSNGTTVAISSNRVNTGQVRVFRNIAGSWTQIGQNINGEAAGDGFGVSMSLSLSGRILAVGAPGNDGNGDRSGHVRVFEYISSLWIQIGQDIDGERLKDQSGTSVSLSSDGTIVAIGAPRNRSVGGRNAGHARIYKNISGIWTQDVFDINGENQNENSGSSVSLSSDGSIVAIGAPNSGSSGDDPPFEKGRVRIFDLTTPLSTPEFESSGFTMIPNPAKTQFTIQLQNNQELEQVNIYNNLGQLVKTAQTKIIKTTNLATGIYYVEVITNTGKATKKLIIE